LPEALRPIRPEKRPGNAQDNLMNRYKVLGFVVIAAHGVAAVGHLLLTAQVLPAPDNRVNVFAIGMLTAVHLAVSIVWWKVPNRPAGLILSTFFIAVLAFGIYEHFLHPGANNVFMVLPGVWKTTFEASVVLLMALEVLGAGIGLRFLRGQGQLRGLPLAT
jgi:hypothetical protein